MKQIIKKFHLIYEECWKSYWGLLVCIFSSWTGPCLHIGNRVKRGKWKRLRLGSGWSVKKWKRWWAEKFTWIWRCVSVSADFLAFLAPPVHPFTSWVYWRACSHCPNKVLLGGIKWYRLKCSWPKNCYRQTDIHSPIALFRCLHGSKIEHSLEEEKKQIPVTPKCIFDVSGFLHLTRYEDEAKSLDLAEMSFLWTK